MHCTSRTETLVCLHVYSGAIYLLQVGQVVYQGEFPSVWLSTFHRSVQTTIPSSCTHRHGVDQLGARMGCGRISELVHAQSYCSSQQKHARVLQIKKPVQFWTHNWKNYFLLELQPNCRFVSILVLPDNLVDI